MKGLSSSGAANPLKVKNNIKVGKSPNEGTVSNIGLKINEPIYIKIVYAIYIKVFLKIISIA